MQYRVKICETCDWSSAEVASIDKYVWGGSYRPLAAARALYVPNTGLFVRLTCREHSPKAVYTEFYQPVYKDSCLEFFADIGNTGKYVNCEMNSNGALLMGFGEGRHGRVHIDELTTVPQVKATRGEDEWSVEILLCDGLIDELWGARLSEGSRFRGNFYKCGDETEIIHYGMWSPVRTDSPDFHRPEYFGEFVLVR